MLNFDKIKYELDIDGFSVVEPSIDLIQLSERLSLRFDSRFIESQSTGYKVNIFRENDIQQKANHDLLDFNNFCKKIISELFGNILRLDAIFQTFDSPSSRHIAQDPHFDRIPTLKFMLYANTLTHKNGAFCISPGSHHWTKKRLGTNRKSHGAKGFLEESRQIPTFIKDRIYPVEGMQGTVIIFDTDCIHHQGVVLSESAKIFRSHYRPTRMSPKKILFRNLLKNQSFNSTPFTIQYD